jgi:hypothetical protein
MIRGCCVHAAAPAMTATIEQSRSRLATGDQLRRRGPDHAEMVRRARNDIGRNGRGLIRDKHPGGCARDYDDGAPALDGQTFPPPR